jgi:hypothetical protein
MFTKRFFWIMYFIWLVANIMMFVMAYSNVFGEYYQPHTEFWPFTIGDAKYYDFAELFVYTGLPLLFYLLYNVVHKHELTKSAE